MVKKITRSVIAALTPSPPSGTKNVVWDQHLPGFGVYVTQSGRASFVYQYRMHKGRTKSILIGYNSEFSIEQAREVAADYAQQRRKGIDPIALLQEKKNEERANEELVLANYARAWLERRILARKPLNKAQTAVVERDVIGELGDVRLDRMTVRDVEKFSSTLGMRGESARRMGLVYLKAILNDARRRDLIRSSPADAVETPKSGERLRRLTEAVTRLKATIASGSTGYMLLPPPDMASKLNEIGTQSTAFSAGCSQAAGRFRLVDAEDRRKKQL